jgi:nucleotide-binding universal stress UspA family protein
MTGSPETLGILVGADGSPASRMALRWAAEESVLRGVPVTIVHVLGTETIGNGLTSFPTPLASTELATWREAEGRRILAAASRIARERPPGDDGEPVRRRLVWGAPAPVLIDWSDRAELVVLGRRGQGAFRNALLGSISAAVGRHAHAPVAVIDGEECAPALATRTSVLVGIDGSADADCAAAVAFGEASRRRLDLVALHAWTDAEVERLGSMEDSSAQRFAAKLLRDRLAGLERLHPEVAVHHLVVDGAPAAHLIEHSAYAQLTVVGRRGRGGFESMLMGSVGGAVLQAARSPVIVTPPRTSATGAASDCTTAEATEPSVIPSNPPRP